MRGGCIMHDEYSNVILINRYCVCMIQIKRFRDYTRCVQIGLGLGLAQLSCCMSYSDHICRIYIRLLNL